jgi:hypothetical protein
MSAIVTSSIVHLRTAGLLPQASAASVANIFGVTPSAGLGELAALEWACRRLYGARARIEASTTASAGVWIYRASAGERSTGAWDAKPTADLIGGYRVISGALQAHSSTPAQHAETVERVWSGAVGALDAKAQHGLYQRCRARSGAIPISGTVLLSLTPDDAKRWRLASQIDGVSISLIGLSPDAETTASLIPALAAELQRREAELEERAAKLRALPDTTTTRAAAAAAKLAEDRAEHNRWLAEVTSALQTNADALAALAPAAEEAEVRDELAAW